MRDLKLMALNPGGHKISDTMGGSYSAKLSLQYKSEHVFYVTPTRQNRSSAYQTKDNNDMTCANNHRVAKSWPRLKIVSKAR